MNFEFAVIMSLLFIASIIVNIMFWASAKNDDWSCNDGRREKK